MALFSRKKTVVDKERSKAIPFNIETWHYKRFNGEIAANTFKESVREPIFSLLLLCAVLLIANFPFVSIFVFYDQVKLVVDSSMATTMLFGLFAAVLCASHTVSREMRDGTVLLLFSKPIHRATFILGKIAGIMVASLLFVLVCNAA